jgi:hypothetical protein
VFLDRLPVQGHEHDGAHPGADGLRIEDRHLSGNHPIRLVASDAPMHRARRQADGLAQLAQGAPGVVLEEIEQAEVDLIEWARRGLTQQFCVSVRKLSIKVEREAASLVGHLRNLRGGEAWSTGFTQ